MQKSFCSSTWRQLPIFLYLLGFPKSTLFIFTAKVLYLTHGWGSFVLMEIFTHYIQIARAHYSPNQCASYACRNPTSTACLAFSMRWVILPLYNNLLQEEAHPTDCVSGHISWTVWCYLRMKKLRYEYYSPHFLRTVIHRENKGFLFISHSLLFCLNNFMGRSISTSPLSEDREGSLKMVYSFSGTMARELSVRGP